MGTRSLTYFYDDKFNNTEMQDPLLCFYRQYDGYIAGHGFDLGFYLSKFKVVNGLGRNDDTEIRIANGMGCLSAQMIALFKTEAGNIYISAPVLNQDCGQEYEYHIYQDKIEAFSLYSSYGKTKTKLFSGSWVEFFEYCQATKKQEEKEVA
jgi:hypothetical protein